MNQPVATLALDVDAIAASVADELQRRGAARDQGAAQLAITAAGRLTLSKAEAAEALGMSTDHLERHVLPELRIVRSGRLVLIPVDELNRWVQEHAARTLEGNR